MKKSCRNCSHKLVCEHRSKAGDYVRACWGGTAFKPIFAGLELLIGDICSNYKALSEKEKNG